MSTKSENDQHAERALRDLAEARLRSRLPIATEVGDDHALVYELQVNQIELEIQNEALLNAQAALQKSHDRYLDLYELSPFAYLTLDQDGRIDEANMTASYLFGVEHDSLIGILFASLLTSDNAGRWFHFFSAQIKRGGRQSDQFEIARDGGETVCVRVDCLGVRREHFGLGVHVALTDISEQRRSEIALLESEARYRTAFAKARHGMVIADVETGRFVDANDAFLEIIGCKREAMPQFGITSLKPGSPKVGVSDPYDRLAAGEETVAESVLLRRLDGSTLSVDIFGSPFVQDGTRRILGEFHQVAERGSIVRND